jgi:LacI family repressor for deo operon, udp, cdd, tsx, nupC, and nupG
MTAKLAEIAERAGVSVASVSRVLNGKPGVAASTRQAVLTAVDVLGYERPSRLRQRAAGLVGLVVPELENPIFPRLATAVEVALSRRGYTPVLCTQSPGGVHEDDYVATLLDRAVSGIIFVSGVHAVQGADPGRYRRLVAAGLPIVLVNGYLEGVAATFISADDTAAVEVAVGHLAQMRHRRIGLALGQPRYQPVVRRLAAFGDAMRRHVDPDLTSDQVGELVSCTVFTVEGGASAADTLLDRGVTAIVCGSDLMALGAIEAARRRGLRVPADVSVVGSDDSKLIQYANPPLTTVRQPVEAMGAAAASALVDQISGVPPMSSELLYRPELVVRGSTGGCPEPAPGGRQHSGASPL